MAVLTVTTLPTPYGTTPSTVTWNTASGVSDTYPSTGKEIVILRNDGAGTPTVTIESVNCPHGRQGDSTIALEPSAYGASQLFPPVGWRDGSGNVTITCADANVKIAVLRIP